MDIRQLQYFVQVADCGSYSLASQQLFVSQPALSKAIKSIEDEMGFKFFYTYQRKQKLTDAGLSFYEKTVNFLESYDVLINTTYLDAGVDKGHLNIGLSIMGGPALFSHLLPTFKEKYPQITVSILEKETNMLKEEILKKNLDLAFIDLYHIKTPEDADNFEIFKIATSEIVIVASKENEVAQLEEIQYSALNNRNLILFNDGHEYSGQVRNDMKLMGVKPNVVLSSTQWDFIIDMVANDIGIVLCPYYIYKKYENPKICCIPLDEKMGKREIGIIVRKENYKTRACMKFLEYATDPASYKGIQNLFPYKEEALAAPNKKHGT